MSVVKMVRRRQSIHLVVWSLSSATNSEWSGRPWVTPGARRQARRQELARVSPYGQENRDGPLLLVGARPTPPADRIDILTSGAVRGGRCRPPCWRVAAVAAVAEAPKSGENKQKVWREEGRERQAPG